MILHSNALQIPLADKSIHCVVTSPPYFNLRDYNDPAQIGLEPLHDCGAWAQHTTAPRAGFRQQQRIGRVQSRSWQTRVNEPCERCYVCQMRAVFREVWRVLRDDGTCWLNIGDSYAANRGYQVPQSKDLTRNELSGGNFYAQGQTVGNGLKPKDLCLIPQRLALALQADGWYVRNEIIWHKKNGMPESAIDRCTKSHEQVWLLAKSARYYFDNDVIREPHKRFWDESNIGKNNGWATGEKTDQVLGRKTNPNCGLVDSLPHPLGRNKRDVWSIATQPYSGAHFAVMPPKLVEPCILAGSPEGGIVFDPFTGAGTVGMVAREHNRRFVGTEINLDYIKLANGRGYAVQPMLAGLLTS